METKFESTFESLRGYKVPDWFRDVKFGIWSHWGPQSVPMYGDWYARNMYIEGFESVPLSCPPLRSSLQVRLQGHLRAVESGKV